MHLLAYGRGFFFARRAQNFRREALATRFFDEVHVFTKLPDRITSDTRWKLHSKAARGAGYWFWKSALILDLFNTSIAYGDVLVYLDAGSRLGNLSGWEDLLGTLCRHDIIAFQIDQPEPMWTKGDIFKRFSVGYEDAPYGTHEQICGTYIIMRKTVRSELFVKHWQDLVSDFQLVSDKPSRAPNSLQFRENRHDQSLFSMLVKANSPVGLRSRIRPELTNLTYALHKEFGIAGLSPIVMRDIGYPPRLDLHPFAAARCSGVCGLLVKDVPSCGPSNCSTQKQKLYRCPSDSSVPTIVHPPSTDRG